MWFSVVLMVGLVIIICFAIVFENIMGRRLKGRTRRHFHTDKDVLSIMDQWSDKQQYHLEKRDNGSRTYMSINPRTIAFYPMVRVTKSDDGYDLETWLVPRIYFRIITFMWFIPHDIVVDKQSFLLGWGDWHPFDPRHLASMDTNALFAMLDAAVEPIP